MVGYIIKDKFVALPTLREILLGVINHMVCTNRSHQLYIPCAAHAGHFRAERLGNLHGECPNTS